MLANIINVIAATQVCLCELVVGEHIQAGKGSGNNGSQLAQQAMLQQLLRLIRNLSAPIS